MGEMDRIVGRNVTSKAGRRARADNSIQTRYADHDLYSVGMDFELWLCVRTIELMILCCLAYPIDGSYC